MIHPNAYIFPDCKIGKNCRFGANVVIGSLGLLCRRGEDNKLTRVKSEGSVIIEDNVDIGAGSCIQRGKIGNTVIGQGTFIGPMTNIGHDVKIGKNCIIGNKTLIAGFVTVGDNTRINICSVIRNRVKIGSNVVVGMGSLVMHDVPDNTTVVGRPAVDIVIFRRRRKIMQSYVILNENNST